METRRRIFFRYASLVVLTAPLMLVDLVFAAITAGGSGRLGEIGRGMLIGWLAVPISLVIVIPAAFFVLGRYTPRAAPPAGHDSSKCW